MEKHQVDGDPSVRCHRLFSCTNLRRQGAMVRKRPVIVSGVSTGMSDDMSGDPQIFGPELFPSFVNW